MPDYVSNPSPRTTEPEFDPFAYHADIIANPEKYISMAQILRDVQSLRAIRNATTLQGLKLAFAGPARAAKDSGDTFLLHELTEAKNRRKAELGD